MYWERTDNWYNFATNVTGKSHVLASVVEDPFGPQPAGNSLDGIAGGTMGASHPISFCKDFQGGRSFYTGLGNTVASYDATLREHLKGAIAWAAGQSDPSYSDCGATVLKNYQQVKVTQQPNLNEPIGIDQLPDGRILQTARRGERAPARPEDRHHEGHRGPRQHRPADDAARLHELRGRPVRPGGRQQLRHRQVGVPLLRPADRHRRQALDGAIVTQTTPNTTVPNYATSVTAWDPYVGYFQLSRFKFVEDANGPRLDLNTEQKILRVSNNRQECCHVAGDIDFDKHNNLWMVTGDDTPAGGITANGYGPFQDQLSDEQQTVRTNNATGGTFTLSFDGQTTAPIPYNATAAQVDSALEALSNIGANNIQTSGGPANTAVVNVFFRRALSRKNVAADHGQRRRPHGHQPDRGRRDGDVQQRLAREPVPRGRRPDPAPDRRRPPLDAEHQRPARQDPPRQGQGR